jgi:hypothetical protein
MRRFSAHSAHTLWCMWLVVVANVIAPAVSAADLQCMKASPCQLMCRGACTNSAAAVPGALVTDAHGRGVTEESAVKDVSTAITGAITMQDIIDRVVAAAEAQVRDLADIGNSSGSSSIKLHCLHTCRQPMQVPAAALASNNKAAMG